jgi:aminopeptidase N
VIVLHAAVDTAGEPTRKRRFAYCSDPPSVSTSFIQAFNSSKRCCNKSRSAESLSNRQTIAQVVKK